jgi:hypothetical protein
MPLFRSETMTATLWTVKYDQTEEDYPWSLIDPDGEVDDCFDTETAARAEADRYNRRDKINAIREKCVGLIDALEDRDQDHVWRALTYVETILDDVQ